jgi:hypothetical protein
MTTIALGAVATIFLGLGTNDRLSVLKNIAIIPTALITAISTFSAFIDYRGSVARTAKAESDLSTLMTNIDKELLKAVAQAKFIVDRDTLDKWRKDADVAIKGVDEDWLAHFSQRNDADYQHALKVWRDARVRAYHDERADAPELSP